MIALERKLDDSTKRENTTLSFNEVRTRSSTKAPSMNATNQTFSETNNGRLPGKKGSTKSPSRSTKSPKGSKGSTKSPKGSTKSPKKKGKKGKKGSIKAKGSKGKNVLIGDNVKGAVSTSGSSVITPCLMGISALVALLVFS